MRINIPEALIAAMSDTIEVVGSTDAGIHQKNFGSGRIPMKAAAVEGDKAALILH